MKLISVAIILITALFGTIASAETKDYEYAAGGINTLSLKHEEGKLFINGEETGSIKIKVEKVKGGSSCVTKVKPQGGTLSIETKHSLLSGLTCQVDIVVNLPKNISINADIGASSLQLSRLDGNLKLNVGAGQVSGSVSSKETHIKLGAGHVDLDWQKAFDVGLLDINVGAGIVNLNFPKNFTVDSIINNGFGSVTNTLHTSTASGFKLRAKIGFGSIALNYHK